MTQTKNGNSLLGSMTTINGGITLTSTGLKTKDKKSVTEKDRK